MLEAVEWVNKTGHVRGQGVQKESGVCTGRANHKSSHHCWGLGTLPQWEERAKTSPDLSSLCPPPLAAGQAAQTGRISQERHCTPAAAGGTGWSLWAWACTPDSNKQCKCAGQGRTGRSAVFFPVCAESHFLVSMETSCCRNVMKMTSKIKANRFALL